jgi:hypothetical protein
VRGSYRDNPGKDSFLGGNPKMILACLEDKINFDKQSSVTVYTAVLFDADFNCIKTVFNLSLSKKIQGTELSKGCTIELLQWNFIPHKTCEFGVHQRRASRKPVW